MDKPYIASVTVLKLFGRFDYALNFQEKNIEQNGIVTLTAPNGYGKSTILKLINDFIGGRPSQLVRVAFDDLQICSSDGDFIIVSKTIEESSSEQKLTFKYFYANSPTKISEQIVWKWRPESSEVDEIDELSVGYGSMKVIRSAERDFGLTRRGANEWRDINGRLYRREDLHQLIESRSEGDFDFMRNEQGKIKEFRAKLSVIYISANRLRVLPSGAPTRRGRSEMIEIVCDRVLDQLTQMNQLYAATGRELEQKFPNRVLDCLRDGSKNVSTSDIGRLISEVESLERQFQSLGLLGDARIEKPNLKITDNSALIVLEMYLLDIKSKLNKIKPSAERLRLFVETINSMLMFKSLHVVTSIGFEVRDEKSNVIPLRALSSGEQHLIVLLGEIIFATIGDGLILLDEPEISFHPEWQERIPTVLKSVAKLNGCKVVLATHSPMLADSDWESVIELADQVR